MILAHDYYLKGKNGKVVILSGKVSPSQLRYVGVPDDLINDYQDKHFTEQSLDLARYNADEEYHQRKLEQAHQALKAQQKIEEFLSKKSY